MNNFYEGKKVILTGASGFIGSTLMKILMNFGASVQPLGEAKDLRACDIVFLLGWQTDTQRANKDPFHDYDTCVLSLLSILRYLHNYNSKARIVFAGTATQIGFTSSDEPVYELAKDNPITIYDIHKQLVENYLAFYAQAYGMSTVTLRLTNVYGPGKKPSSDNRGTLNKMILRALDGKDIILYSPSLIRDYVYIDDVINALMIAGSRHERGTYLIGSGVGYSFQTAAELILKMVSQDQKLKISHVRQAFQSLIDMRSFVADITNFRNTTGWSPSICLEEGIARTIEYYSGLI